MSFFIVLLAGCGAYDNTDRNPSVEGDINDKASWYDIERDSVTPMYVTFNDPNEYECSPYDDIMGLERPCTFDDVNNDLNPTDEYKPILHVHMSTPDYNQTLSSNAGLSIKGNFTRQLSQKSYTVKLDKDIPLYLKQRKFPLTKSQSDRSRLRNRIAFSLMRTIPNITSLSVNFYHLYINGEDYGLFNQAEAIREEYLVNRGWDPKDHLYNTVNFLFDYKPYFMELDSAGEPLYPDRFEQILEIKTGKDNSKLIEMLEAVDSTNDIDAVIAKYFNRKNYLTWMAINLILGDKDTIQHNFYLYNPRYSDVFYFLPWDYDGAWSTPKYLKRREYGISVWWASTLHRKFLSVKKNRDDLYALADEIRAKYITDKNVQALIDKYLPIVLPYQSVWPDSQHNSESSCISGSQDLVTRLQENVDLYKSVIGSPMPFDERVSYDTNSSTLSVDWDESVDLEGDTIVYDINLSKDTPDNVIFTEENLTQKSLTKVMPLEAGTYYIQVKAKEKDNSEHYQYSYSFTKFNDTIYDGFLEFNIE
jgi:spore coat protein H